MKREAVYRGKTYNLSHLQPFLFRVEFGGKAYVVRVKFSDHCFTEKFDPERHGKNDLLKGGQGGAGVQFGPLPTIPSPS